MFHSSYKYINIYSLSIHNVVVLGGSDKSGDSNVPRLIDSFHYNYFIYRHVLLWFIVLFAGLGGFGERFWNTLIPHFVNASASHQWVHFILCTIYITYDTYIMYSKKKPQRILALRSLRLRCNVVDRIYAYSIDRDGWKPVRLLYMNDR